MDKDFFKNWEMIRAKGKAKYILTQGLAYALFMMVAMGFFTYFMDRKP